MIPVWILILDGEEKNKLEVLYNDFGKQMWAIAASILKTREDVDDAVSEAFIKIADNMDKLESRSLQEARAFCAVVVKNTAKDIRRKNIKRTSLFTELNEDITPSPLNSFDQYELQQIRQYLLKLPEELKEAVWMYHLLNIPVKQIARIQNVAEITVYKRIERGKNKLLELLKAGDIDAD